MSGRFVVAIDGPAGSGKSTLGETLAHELGFTFLDTGLLYRAVGQRVGEAEDADALTPEAFEARAVAAAEALTPADLKAPGLEATTVGHLASRVAAIPAVRQALLDMQRHLAQTPPGAVLVGRDIGSVVCPGAEAKIFVTASVEARARRRVQQLRQRGVVAIYADVLADLRSRDERDGGRTVAPLLAPDDAFLLDTTEMDLEAALAAARRYISDQREGARR